MRSHDIRARFLDFFERRGHRLLPSASLIPHDDPSLLFTAAGMVPLKPYILGMRRLDGDRATSCQKCFRADDIESVGDASHHTFFEMLGNWSFGDYFKEGAITLAWELLTEGFGLDPDRLRPSVYPDDDLAERIWVERIGVRPELVSHLEDNWWQAGPTGPCGYDSEVYWDWGSPCSCGRADCSPQDECGGDRWTEIWNLVFMEFDQDGSGTRTPLPRPCVDTGMGLERMSAVLQGVRSTYDTDLLLPLIEDFAGRSDADPARPSDALSLRVLADHLRGTAFLLGDGVVPGNEGRGYVLRRVLRRASLHGRRIGLRGGLTGGVGALVSLMGDVYPELSQRSSVIEAALRDEEAAFDRTLAQGLERLERLLGEAAGHIGGADAFRLHDTYGFPIELTLELASERGVEVDMAGFAAAMEAQRTRSRATAGRTGFTAGEALPSSSFVGYDALETEAEVVHAGTEGVLRAGESGGVVLEPTPFYAESGGQIGDTGVLEWEDGSAVVTDTQHVAPTEARVSTVRVVAGELRVARRVRARVDAERRLRTARHHSATHLLHKALREVLGDTVAQRGSWVGPEHTTFDFSFGRGLTDDELHEVEHLVNEAIRHNLRRTAVVMPIAEARSTGAVAIFDEKYGEQVRVVDFGGWSRELCGGTHVERSGDIGAVILASEGSIGQGLRRIDMLAGDAAERRWSETSRRLRETAAVLRVPPDEVPARVAALQAQLREARRDAEAARRRSLGGEQVGIEEVDGVRLATMLLEGDRRAVLAAADGLFAERLQGRGVAVVLGSDSLAVKVGREAVEAGVDAGGLVRLAVAATGGSGGGGSPDRGQGAVGDPARRAEALSALRSALARAGGDGPAPA